MIKLEHTLFALPFAIFGMLIAKISGYELNFVDFIWIAIAFAGARSAAMGFNRIVDANIDAKNPRTSNRAIAQGRISKKSALLFVLISICVMMLSAYMLNPLCFYLSLPALCVLLGYSYCKRFTLLCHFVLGLALSLAPIGAWIAISGNFNWRIIFAGATLLFQIAAFDILYALQDFEFDVQNKLYSIPSRLGKRNSLIIVPMLLALSSFSLFATGCLFDLGTFFYICATLVSIIYLTGFITFLNAGLNKINLVFFYMNASCSFLIMASVLPKAFL